ncbi:TPA: hypothetical protein RNX49_001582 [Pasteurella multocida]|nr:hypothetical protein [Pasteurella multocida]
MRIKPVSVACIVYEIAFNATFYLAVFHGNDGVKELMKYIFSILTAICIAFAIFAKRKGILESGVLISRNRFYVNVISSLITSIVIASTGLSFLAALYFISNFIGNAKLADIEEKYS